MDVKYWDIKESLRRNRVIKKLTRKMDEGCRWDRNIPYIDKIAFAKLMKDVAETVGTEKAEKLLMQFRASSHPSLVLFQFLRQFSKQTDVQGNIGWVLKNIVVPGCSLFKKSKHHTEIQGDDQSALKMIYRFVNTRSNPVRISDLLPVVRKWQVLDEDRFKELCRATTWMAEPHPKAIMKTLSVPLTVGVSTATRIKSYCKLAYPLGYPECSGQSAADVQVQNNDWIASQMPNQEGRKRDFIPVVQVNDELKAIENDNCMLNVEICRNNNVLKYFITKGPVGGYDSPIIRNELIAIYGARGPIMLQLLQDYPTVVHAKIVNRLKQRAKLLYEQKLQLQPKWARRLEKVLPQQQNKYMGVLFADDEHATIFAVGRDPIPYKIENTFLILKLMEIYQHIFLEIYQRPSLEVDQALVVATTIIGELRHSVGVSTIKTTFMHAAALCSAARFVNFFGDPNDYDDGLKTSLVIPLEVGITLPELHGFARVLKIVAETQITRRYQDNAQELSGLFKNVTLQKALQVIRSGELLIKCLIKYTKDAQQEAEIVQCSIENGQLSISSLVTTPCDICLDLSVVDYY